MINILLRNQRTHEIILEIGMHVINAVVHDSRGNAFARVSERPGGLHVQIKLRYTTRLSSVVLHKKYIII